MGTSPRQKPPLPFPNPRPSLSGLSHWLSKAADGRLWLLPGLQPKRIESRYLQESSAHSAVSVVSHLPLDRSKVGGISFLAFSLFDKGRPAFSAPELLASTKVVGSGSSASQFYITQPPSFPRDAGVSSHSGCCQPVSFPVTWK